MNEDPGDAVDGHYDRSHQSEEAANKAKTIWDYDSGEKLSGRSCLEFLQAGQGVLLPGWIFLGEYWWTRAPPEEAVRMGTSHNYVKSGLTEIKSEKAARFFKHLNVSIIYNREQSQNTWDSETFRKLKLDELSRIKQTRQLLRE